MKATFSQKLIDFANVFKAFFGATYLTMPFCFHQSGIIFGIVMLLIIGWLTDHCCNKIVRCKAIIISRLMDKFELKLNDGSLPIQEAELFQNGKLRSRWENRMTLGHIAKYAYGKKAQWIVTLCLFISQFGFCTGYFVFIGNTLQELLNYTTVNRIIYFNSSIPSPGTNNGGIHIPLTYLVMMTLPVFSLFSLLRSVRNIGWISALATFTVAFGFLTVFVLLLNGFTINSNFYYVKFATLPMVFGLLTGGFEGIGTVIPIESSMIGNRHNFAPYLHITLSFMVFILAVFGILGHLRYGEGTQQIILQNFPFSIFVSIVNAVLIISVLCTYPLQMFPVSEIVEFLIFRKRSSEIKNKCLNNVDYSSSIDRSTKNTEDYKDLLEELTADGNEPGETLLKPRRRYRNSSFATESGDVANYGSIVSEDFTHNVFMKSPQEIVFTKKEERMIRIIHGSKITAPTWIRNTIRIIVVLLQMLLAVAMRDKYAYLNAFIGAIGCSFLAYILPAATHYKLTKGTPERLCYGVGDMLIIIFGIIGSITSFVVTVMEVIR